MNTMSEAAPFNAGSYFISRAIKMFRKIKPEASLFITYCELDHGFEGAVFRASNWLYSGISEGGFDLIVKGSRVQNRSKYVYLSSKKVPRTRKARYLFMA